MEGARGHGIGRRAFLALIAAAATSGALAADEDEFAQARARLMRDIARDARETWPWTGRKGFSERTMAAMAAVPRHLFVHQRLQARAYENRPLPIGHGQTISQPYIVALMTDLLDLQGGETILEVGTGSGYQAAVLAQSGARVYTIEIIEPLAREAAARIERLAAGVVTRHGDGYYGWSEHAPFDAIVVTAAATHVPPPLLKQLKPGGRMVIPVGARFLTQQLVVVDKDENGALSTRQLLPVRFVPFTGQH